MPARVAAVLLLAAVLRIAMLGSNPAGVFHDEAEKAYSAWSLARTGGVFDFTKTVTDNRGVVRPSHTSWPLFHNVWGTRTSMVAQYGMLPFVAVGGMNAWTARLPGALMGVLAVWLAWLLARHLFEDEGIAFWAALMVAVSPWHLVFSRWALQGIYVPVFLSGSLVLFLKGERRPAWWLVSALLMAAAFYAYSGARPFLFLLGVAVLVIWRRVLWRQRAWAFAAAAVLVAGLLPSLHAMFFAESGMGRWQAVSVFGGEGPLIHKLALFAWNYARHLCPDFLFLTGDANLRHSVTGFGVMLHVEAVFLLWGLWVAMRDRTRSDRLLVAWFLLFPVSAALTREGVPHALRTLHAVPAAQLLAARGAVGVWEFLSKRGEVKAWRYLQGIWALNAVVFAVCLFAVYPKASAEYFEYGIARACGTFREEAGPDRVLHVVPGEALPYVPELYMYHLHPDPREVLDQGMAGVPFRPFTGGRVDPRDSLLMDLRAYNRWFDPLVRRGEARVGFYPLRPDGAEHYCLVQPVGR